MLIINAVGRRIDIVLPHQPQRDESAAAAPDDGDDNDDDVFATGRRG